MDVRKTLIILLFCMVSAGGCQYDVMMPAEQDALIETSDLTDVDADSSAHHQHVNSSGEPSLVKVILTGKLIKKESNHTDSLSVFELLVSNPQHYDVPLQFMSGKTADLSLFRADKPVWIWSQDKMFTLALREENLASGESLSVSFEVPSEVLAQVQPGDVWHSSFMGLSPSSMKPLLMPVKIEVK